MTQFAPVVGAWARAAGLERADVEQDIRLAVLQGLDPASAVPKVLGIRRLGRCGPWRSRDLSVVAAEIDPERDDLSAEEADDEDEEVIDQSGLVEAAAGGSAEIAKRADITRRAGQMRIKKQVKRIQQNGDLFIDPPPPSKAGGVRRLHFGDSESRR